MVITWDNFISLLMSNLTAVVIGMSFICLLILFVYFKFRKNSNASPISIHKRLSEELLKMNSMNRVPNKFLYVSGIATHAILSFAKINCKISDKPIIIKSLGIFNLQKLLYKNIPNYLAKKTCLIISNDIASIQTSGINLPADFSLYHRYQYCFNLEDNVSKKFITWFKNELKKETVDDFEFAQLLKGTVVDLTKANDILPNYENTELKLPALNKGGNSN